MNNKYSNEKTTFNSEFCEKTIMRKIFRGFTGRHYLETYTAICVVVSHFLLPYNSHIELSTNFNTNYDRI